MQLRRLEAPPTKLYVCPNNNADASKNKEPQFNLCSDVRWFLPSERTTVTSGMHDHPG